eukprot:SAG31_NODE_9305_length_1300_cov_37.817652_1_plen_77_part_10
MSDQTDCERLASEATSTTTIPTMYCAQTETRRQRHADTHARSGERPRTLSGRKETSRTAGTDALRWALRCGERHAVH